MLKVFCKSIWETIWLWERLLLLNTYCDHDGILIADQGGKLVEMTTALKTRLLRQTDTLVNESNWHDIFSIVHLPSTHLAIQFTNYLNAVSLGEGRGGGGVGLKQIMLSFLSYAYPVCSWEFSNDKPCFMEPGAVGAVVSWLLGCCF